MEELINQKTKSPLEKIAPVVLIIGVVILGYFILSKFQTTTVSTNNQLVVTPTIQVEVDTNFLMLEAFTKLKYIPDSSVFNDVTGEVPKGRENPFAPVK
jgi:hypothetical protein